jgi:hypothetical protein
VNSRRKTLCKGPNFRYKSWHAVPILTPEFPFLLENMHAFTIRLNERRPKPTKAAVVDAEV